MDFGVFLQNRPFSPQTKSLVGLSMSAPPVASFSVKDPNRSDLIKVSKTTKNSAKQGFPTFGFPRVGFRSNLFPKCNKNKRQTHFGAISAIELRQVTKYAENRAPGRLSRFLQGGGGELCQGAG